MLDSLTIALGAVSCGAESWTKCEAFGHAKRAWLRTVLPLPNGIPSHDPVGRVFAALDRACLTNGPRMTHADRTATAIAQLSDRRSAQRRAGAKRLRQQPDPAAGPALLAALRREVRDPRTWETQYHLIMALAACGYTPALPTLDDLTYVPFEATMVYVALGDAIVRLAREHEHDARPVLALMQRGNDMLIDGAFRAVALLRLTPDDEAIREIISFVARRSPHDPLRFWVAAAAPGWRGPHVETFLQACSAGPRPDVREAAVAALQQRYLTWHPL